MASTAIWRGKRWSVIVSVPSREFWFGRAFERELVLNFEKFGAYNNVEC